MSMPSGEPGRARARVEELRSRVSGAQAAQLREGVRAEEAARLAGAAPAGAGLDAAQRKQAAEAFARLFEYFAIASASKAFFPVVG